MCILHKALTIVLFMTTLIFVYHLAFGLPMISNCSIPIIAVAIGIIGVWIGNVGLGIKANCISDL